MMMCLFTRMGMELGVRIYTGIPDKERVTISTDLRVPIAFSNIHAGIVWPISEGCEKRIRLLSDAEEENQTYKTDGGTYYRIFSNNENSLIAPKEINSFLQDRTVILVVEDNGERYLRCIEE